MHDTVRNALSDWLESIGGAADMAVADLGARNLNGSVKSVVPHALGFDLSTGPGIDVVIEAGSIPEEHRGRYDLVTSVSSFQFFPRPLTYKDEITQLLKPGGVLFLTMCAPTCVTEHTTVPPYGDCLRLSVPELTELMRPEIEMRQTILTGADGHEDIIFIGART
jgi:hypothetical protein